VTRLLLTLAAWGAWVALCSGYVYLLVVAVGAAGR
jgi:hypothetical protein